MQRDSNTRAGNVGICFGIWGNRVLNGPDRAEEPEMIRLLSLLSVFVGVCVCQFPIPRRYDGFVYGEHVAEEDPVLVEAFFDPLCPDSKAVWPALKEVLAKYGSELKFILHPFALPYHHNSFFSARALHIADRLNSSFTYPLLDVLFDHQYEFSNAETASETPSSVIDRFSSLFASHLGENEFDSFQAGFYNSATDMATRISFKYACSRAVTGTPVFLVNGVALYDVDDTWGVDKWSKVLDPLVGEYDLMK